MFEKVNPCHPDKVADRIAGAFVDYAYSQMDDPKIAVEVLIGHGVCHIITESSVYIPQDIAEGIVKRIGGNVKVDFVCLPQDEELARNQNDGIRCGDNGIFKGMPETEEQKALVALSDVLYSACQSDGKYILNLDRKTCIVCQSNAKSREVGDLVSAILPIDFRTVVNPIGEWTGGTNVDTGATNRKLGSDMGDSVTGGGLHGKDLSKADVSVNIYAHLKAQKDGEPIELYCAIGDDYIYGKPYAEIVEVAREYIKSVGGFEKFAEWGLIRPL